MVRSMIWLATALSLLCQVAASQTPVCVTFGTYAFKKPTAVLLQFKPVVEALEKRLTAELGKPATVRVKVTKTYEECLEGFLDGQFDIVRFGPASYVIAKQRNPRIQILAAEREDAAGVGLIVVRDDSPFHELSDLVGKRFAFGDEQSTIGRYMSQAELAKAGVTSKQLASHRFLDRHDIVFKAVELGDFEAGALHLATFKDLNSKAVNKLRVLHSFDNAAKPWLARAGMDAALVGALRRALLAVDDTEALKSLKVPGFVLAQDDEYELVREGMKLAEQFMPAVKPPAQREPTPSPAPSKGG